MKDSIAILLHAKPHGEEGGLMSDKHEVPEDAKAAGEELAAALKSGDGEEIYRKFEALTKICQYLNDKEESEEGDEGNDHGEY